MSSTEALNAKRKNIIEMALEFTAMIRIFVEGSKDFIVEKLEDFFLRLPEFGNRQDYEVSHQSFCEWFESNIRTAKKTLKNGRVQPEGPSSYGQGAKVLDVAIKVYAYYCAQPTPEIAERVVPFLHGAIDNKIMHYLKKSRSSCGKIRATTIKELDEAEYQALQSVLVQECCAYKLHPIQYDDILWRHLNRG